MKDQSNIPPWIRKSRKANQHKQGRTNNNNYQIYNSSRWRKISIKGRKENPQCKKCNTLHVDYKALVRDHIIPINQQGAIYDARNHQNLCKHPCHDIKSGRDQRRYTGPYQTLIHGEDKGRRIPI